MKVKLLAALLSLASTGALAGGAQAHVSRPTARRSSGSHPVVAYTQEFSQNKSGFCNNSALPPCDGAEGDYGTIDRVHSGFSNGGTGDYAPFTSALVGNYYAETYGTQMPSEGLPCPNSSTEYCTGPYALFTSGSTKGQDNVFPTGGFTVTSDLYLSPSTATAGNLVDDDVGLNNSSGSYGRDNVITACPESGGYVINFGNSSPGSCTGTPIISADGWYRFVFVFSDVGGNAYVAEKVIEEDNGSVVANSGRRPEEFPTSTGPTPISQWGGPGYFWLPTEDVSGQPLANVAVQLGVQPNGHTP